MKRTIIPGILIIYILIIFLLSNCGNSKTEKITESLTPVKIVEVKKEIINLPVYSSGKLATTSEVKLSFKVGGIVDKIYVNEGETVKKGKLLAALNMEEIDARFTQAQNVFDKAQRDYSRIKRLFADSVATLEQLQNTETAMEVSKANLKITKFNKKFSKLYAPEDGKILRQLAEQQELVSTGYPVFIFGAGNNSWIARIGVSDKDIVRLKVGDNAFVTTDVYPELKFAAVISEITEKANPYNGSFEIELSLEKTSIKLISGFVIKTKIFPSSNNEYATVPIESIVEGNKNKAFVFTYNDKSQTVKKIRVKTGEIIGNKIIIYSGIEGGTQVVTEGSAYLSDKDKVKKIVI